MRAPGRFAVKQLGSGGAVVSTDYVQDRATAERLAAFLTARPVTEIESAAAGETIPHIRGLGVRGGVRIMELELIS